MTEQTIKVKIYTIWDEHTDSWAGTRKFIGVAGSLERAKELLGQRQYRRSNINPGRFWWEDDHHQRTLVGDEVFNCTYFSIKEHEVEVIPTDYLLDL